jgi:putative phosphoribosyl transferase
MIGSFRLPGPTVALGGPGGVPSGAFGVVRPAASRPSRDLAQALAPGRARALRETAAGIRARADGPIGPAAHPRRMALEERPRTRARDVVVGAGRVRLRGDLAVPPDARGLVVFSHGSGSSRLSPRNRAVARRLEAAGLGTLLLDLLAADEEGRRDLVFDIPLLATRLQAATDWIRGEPDARDLPIGYFGASTGAAAALRAAAAVGDDVRAVVSRGGRPDLAADRLAMVRAPTLLIVGSLDRQVLDLNLHAARRLRCPHRVEVVEGATHLFEEPGTLAVVAGLASDWFLAHLPAPASAEA